MKVSQGELFHNPIREKVRVAFAVYVISTWVWSDFFESYILSDAYYVDQFERPIDI